MKIDLMERLEKYRVANRLSQCEIADKLGISQPTYCRWLCGKGEIALKSYPTIAKLLELRVKDVRPSEFDDEVD